MLGRYFRAAIELQLFPSERRLRRSLRAVFQDRPLRGENVLDIGGGRGLLSMYAGAAGARRVVCLEPEADGSMSGSMSNAETFRRHLGVENVEIVRHTLQEYEPGPMKFDVIVLHKSINHLDEEACIRMLEDASAWGAYRAIAARIANLASQGATLIVCDCGRSNLFSLLGLWNPLAPSIEWHKHQNPPTWIRLFAEEGFGAPSVHWTTSTVLGVVGQALMTNRIAAFLTTSRFRLSMQYRPD